MRQSVTAIVEETWPERVKWWLALGATRSAVEFRRNSMKNKGLDFARETAGFGGRRIVSSDPRSWEFRVIRVTRGLMYPEGLGVEIVSTFDE